MKTNALVPIAMSQRLHKELVDRILANKYIDFPELPPAKENM